MPLTRSVMEVQRSFAFKISSSYPFPTLHRHHDIREVIERLRFGRGKYPLKVHHLIHVIIHGPIKRQDDLPAANDGITMQFNMGWFIPCTAHPILTPAALTVTLSIQRATECVGACGQNHSPVLTAPPFPCRLHTLVQ